MESYLPYIASVLCSIISGITSYFIARKQSKTDIKKLEEQYKLEIEKEREKFNMEKEKMELEFRLKLDLEQKEAENKLGSDVINSVISEYLKSPAGRTQMRNIANKNNR